MPKPRGQRRRIAPGIYADDIGIEAMVSIGSGEDQRVKWKRYDTHTPLREIQAWQEATRTDLRKISKLAPTRRERRTLRRVVKEYLSSLPNGGKSYRRGHLLAWVAVCGDEDPARLKEVALEAHARTWETAGVAASTLNHRKKCLKALYVSLYGEQGYNPARGIKHRREPKYEARGVLYAWVYEVLDHIDEDLESRCRLEAIAFTGMPHRRLMRLRPHDINLRAATVYLLPRLKAAGTVGRSFPLTPEGARALARFSVLDCFGVFSPGGLRSVWRRAWVKANAARALCDCPHRRRPLPWMRPYDLRHTYATWVYDLTSDLRAVADLLDVTLATAQRYIHGAIKARSLAAVKKLAAIQRREFLVEDSGSPEMPGETVH